MFRVPSSSGSDASNFVVSDYERPAHWLPLPDISQSLEHTVTGLVSVGKTTNLLKFTVGGGNFSVDWGDGVVEQFGDGTAADVVAEHLYDFALIPVGNYDEGGRKQVVIKITMGAGYNMTKFLCDIFGYPVGLSSFLELVLMTPELQSIKCRGNKLLKSVVFLSSHKVISFLDAFFSCYGLEYIDLFDTSQVTTFENAFRFCRSLTAKNLKGFSMASVSGRGWHYVFHNCHSLEAIPEGFYVPKGGLVEKDLIDTFSFCYALETLGDADFSGATSFFSTFENCTSLKEVELSVTESDSLDYCFTGCTGLTYVRIINSDNVINANELFKGCINLLEIAPVNFSKVTAARNIIEDCILLKSVPAGFFNTAPGATISGQYFFRGLENLTFKDPIPAWFDSMRYIFYNCRMTEIPLIDTTVIAADWYMAFYNLRYVTVIPAYDASTATNLNDVFQYCFEVKRIEMYNMGVTFSISDCKLDVANIELLFSNLKDLTGLTSQTVTITGNPGVVNLTQAQRDIALNKNWTIVE